MLIWLMLFCIMFIGPLGWNATKVMSIQETISSPNIIQEQQMFQTFSDLVARGRSGVVDENSSHSHASYWIEIALRTQKILDACLISMKSDAQRIEILS